MNKKSLLYPTTKLWIILLMIITIALVPGYKYQYLVLPVVLLIALVCGKFRTVFTNFMKSAFILVLFIFIIQGIFYPGETDLFTIGFITINQEGVALSLVLTSKIVAICSIMILFFATTSIKDLVYALEQLRMPKKLTYVILATLQFIPQMSAKVKTITEAQASRGVEVEGNMLVRLKMLIPLFTPLVLSSLEETEERVLTLEARAFSAKVKKTNVYEIKKHAIDYIITLIVIITIIWFLIGNGGM